MTAAHTRSRFALPTFVAPVLTGAARVALGILWVNEGLLKYRAGFGGADILLVAGSASSNSRVPEYFKLFASLGLHSFPELFGVVMPLLETLLGVALILGLFTLPVGLFSVLTLALYWSADQLITEYPVMMVLSAVVLAWRVPASRYGFPALVRGIGRRRSGDGGERVVSTEPVV